MEAPETDRHQQRRTRVIAGSTFILPSKTNRAIRIVEPPGQKRGWIPSSATESDETARSDHASIDSPSAEARRVVQSPKRGKPTSRDKGSDRTSPSATEQTPKKG